VKLLWQPTHRHVEGGLYQLLARCMIHTAENTWVQGVLYTDSAGELYTRTLDSWDARFEPCDAVIARAGR
jgi:hypothetical protein